MGLVAEQKSTARSEKARSIEVTHKDHTGRVLRVSKYLLGRGSQKPISERIFDSHGGSTLYMYSQTGDDVRRVIRFDKSDPAS